MVPEWLLQVLLLGVSIIGGGAIWYFLSQKVPYKALWSGFAGATLLLLIIALYLQNELIQKETRAGTPVYFGELVPGNEPGPPLPPGSPANTVQLLLGDDLRVLSANSENYVFSKGGNSFLSIGVRNGLMRVSATVMDASNRYVVRILDNEFKANPEHAFNPKQPDKHSLVVRDGDGNEVLNLRFLNPRAMRIVGRFHLPGHSEPVLILPLDGIRWPGGGGIGHLTVDLTGGKGGFIGF